NADTILEEIGIDFREDPESLKLGKDAGAEIQGARVRFPRGMCRSIVRRSAPREFTQYARNPAHNVVIGGNRTVFAPAYGSPFVRNLDEGRRYARIEDFRNFVKLAYMATSLHHSGGTVCERSEEHTSELQSLAYLVCRLLLEKKKNRGRGKRHQSRHNPPGCKS